MRGLLEEEALQDFSISFRLVPPLPSISFFSCRHTGPHSPGRKSACACSCSPLDSWDADDLMNRRCSCRPSGKVIRSSAFCLSLISPVFRTMVCGSFKERAEKRLEIKDEDERALRLAIDLACGREGGVQVVDLREMAGLGAFADRYGMVEVAAAVEEAMVRSVTVETCGEVLCCSGAGASGMQLPRAVSSARALALERFGDLSRSPGFVDLDEDVLCGLVGDDELAAEEYQVLETAVAWIKAGCEEGRGERLLREIRYGLIEAPRLAELGRKAKEILPGRQGALLCDLALEALASPTTPEREGLGHGALGTNAFLQRVVQGVAWADYAEGRRRHRVVRDKKDVDALFGCGGRLYGGMADGAILVWDASTLEKRQRLRCQGKVGGVVCITVCGDLVISGHEDGSLRAWNKATGGCDQVLRGHKDEVRCVASWGQFLVSGACDMKIWAMGGGGSWPCLGTLHLHTGHIWDMVTWNGRVISGSEDKRIIVTDVVTRQREATLDAHTDEVNALAVSGCRLFSAAEDLTIRAWALGTWQHLCSIRIGEHVSEASRPTCLAISGSMLVCGGYRNGDQNGFVLILDADAMRGQHTLLVDELVCCLFSLPGHVWALFGSLEDDCDVKAHSVVVWGKAGGGGHVPGRSRHAVRRAARAILLGRG